MKPYVSVQEIRERYEEGELSDVEDELSDFLRREKSSIHSYQEKLEEKFSERSIDLKFTTKAYILEKRSINPQSEIQREIQLIQQEIDLLEQQNEEVDRDEVVKKWCSKYASAWRERRVMSIIYVFEQDVERYLSILRDS